MKTISHITLICQDIVKSAHLFHYLFNAVEVYSSGEHFFSFSREKYLMVGDLWIALMEGNSIERSYNHIVFCVEESQLSSYDIKIQELGLEKLQDRPRDPREGRSIYFYDYDNHLFELHTGDLEGRLKFYREKL